MPEKDNVFNSGSDKAGHSSNDICRDFLRNVCKRGKRCKFHHPDTNQVPDLGLGVSTEVLPIVKGEVPICRDHLNGDCQRGSKCKFRHIEPESPNVPREQVRSPSLHRYDLYGDIYDEYGHLLKRRRVESMRFDSYDYGVPRPFPVDYRYLEEENLMLRKRVEELKKQASNLMATNEILLEQNAHYRNQPKMVTLTSAAAEQQLAPPTVGTVAAYNHSILQAHSSQALQPRQDLVASAGGPTNAPPTNAPPPSGPHLTTEIAALPAALAQSIAQGMATPVSITPVSVAVSITQSIPGITMSHTTTPMVSYAIASQSMRITPMPH
ncbi:zinc finger CCCH domain-containing protein 10-like [Heptranchias perlo]|uniref:zinc finger CCCH domain-containing protein 10-like n=1 Tax=Heptranchias perlo TaxID=212740 RepID=UPI00355A10FA